MPARKRGKGALLFLVAAIDLLVVPFASATSFIAPSDLDGTHSFNGQSFETVTGWVVVVNDGAGCLAEDDYRSMLAHELGHGLGFDHFTDPEALMYGACCNVINVTDANCARHPSPVPMPPIRTTTAAWIRQMPCSSSTTSSPVGLLPRRRGARAERIRPRTSSAAASRAVARTHESGPRWLPAGAGISARQDLSHFPGAMDRRR